MKSYYEFYKDIQWKLNRRGLCGKKNQLRYVLRNYPVLSDSPRMLLNQRNIKWKRERSEIKSKYHKINIYYMHSTRIGEYTSEFMFIIKDTEKDKNDGILNLFILLDTVNMNKRLMKIISRNISIINETNIDFWMDMMQKEPYLFDVTNILKYVHLNRNLREEISPVQSSKWLSFTQEEEWEGKWKLGLMGINRPFVCIHERDSKYLETIAPDKDYTYHNYRDASINNFAKTAEYLNKQGILTVRMGRDVKEKVSFENCIDYANLYYDEFMDIYLTGKCKFYIGSACGLCTLPMVQNARVALTNYIPVSTPVAIGIPMRRDNLFIFKKYYNMKEHRYLSLREMFMFEAEFGGLRTEDYENQNIKPIENTEEEVLDLAIEMNSRIDGTWVESEKDKMLQKKYRGILEFFIEKYGYNKEAVNQCRVGTYFLRKNAFLFEGEENDL